LIIDTGCKALNWIRNTYKERSFRIIQQRPGA
jgi:hypothetical protein